MGLVLNEYEWAEEMIANHSLGGKPTETLTRVAKYYYENQYSKTEVRKLLDDFMLQCDPQVSLTKWSDTLDRIAKNSAKFRPIQLEGVDVSEGEMKTIEALDGKQIQRLAFTLLCVAKYWDAVSENNDHWVNNPDKEIMQMANINTSIKRQSLMFHNLREAGMIRFSKKVDNLNVQVTFMESDKTALHIHDFRNLGFQCMRYFGGPYFECANCGITVKQQNSFRGRPPKYCPECAIEVHTKQMVDSVTRRRDVQKYEMSQKIPRANRCGTTVCG